MSRGDYLKADQARTIFDRYRSGQLRYNRITAAEQKEAISRWAAVRKKYASRTVLDADAMLEVSMALAPALAAIDQGLADNAPKAAAYDAANAAIVIPPGHIIQAQIHGYCLDPSLPAPGAGEKLQLIPVERRIPAELVELYKALIRYRSAHPEVQPEMQGIVWAFRKGCEDINRAKSLTRDQWALLDRAKPGGARQFADYLAQCHGIQSLPANLVSRLLAPYANTAEDLRRLLTLPIPGSIPEDNSNYNTLDPGVFFETHGTGPLSPQITIINLRNDTYSFFLSDYVAESQRPTQRVALTRPSAVGDARLPSGGWVPSRQTLTDVLKDMTKFLAGKQLDRNIAETTLGKMLRSTVRSEAGAKAVKAAMDVSPLIGNALSLYEAVTGNDWLWGTPLTPAERVLSLAGSVPGLGTLEKLVGEQSLGASLRFAGQLAESSGRYREAAGWVLSDTAGDITDMVAGPGLRPKDVVNDLTSNAAATFKEAATDALRNL